jgi:hypothetical protein
MKTDEVLHLDFIAAKLYCTCQAAARALSVACWTNESLLISLSMAIKGSSKRDVRTRLSLLRHRSSTRLQASDAE